MSETKKFNFAIYAWGAGILGLICFLVILGLALFVPSFFGATSAEMGDTLGGISAPFLNLTGSVLVYLALKAQIKANKQVSKQFKEQEKGEIKRDFENTFFQLLQIHHQIVDKIDLDLKEISEDDSDGLLYQILMEDFDIYLVKPIYSRDVFKITNLIFRILLLTILRHNDGKLKDKKDDLIVLKETYLRIYIKLDSNLGHYFRNLYRIIKLIDEQDFRINDPEKDFKLKYHYTSIVRAQLSDYEVLWLFYNGLSDLGEEKLKPLLERYALLKILGGNQDKVLKRFKELYKPSAYQKTYPEK